jgi:hypothetical protein
MLDISNGLVGTGRFELPTPRTPSECSTRLSHVPTRKEPAASRPQRMGLTTGFYHQRTSFADCAEIVFARAGTRERAPS